NAIGLRCVAAVIQDEHGDALAGISLSGPMARITDDRLPILGKMVQAVAEDITAELGGTSGVQA
ncbi:MAG: IclR family transcriptional regulator C-terminal domain-containing protein, partial [Pseudomonadota bacterium]